MAVEADTPEHFSLCDFFFYLNKHNLDIFSSMNVKMMFLLWQNTSETPFLYVLYYFALFSSVSHGYTRCISSNIIEY